MDIWKDFVNVLENEKRLDNWWFVSMKKDRDSLMNGVRFQKEITFATKILINELIVDTLEVETDLNPVHKVTSWGAKKLHFTFLCHERI